MWINAYHFVIEMTWELLVEFLLQITLYFLIMIMKEIPNKTFASTETY